MNFVEVLIKLFDFVEAPLLVFALFISYKVGGVARGVAYMVVIIILQSSMDAVFANEFMIYYAESEEKYRMILGVSWYFFYVLTSTLVLFAFYTMLRIRPFLLKGFVIGFVLVEVIKVIVLFLRMTEIAYFDSDYTRVPYMYFIPALNNLNLIFIFWGLLHSYRRSKEFGERIEWG